MRPNLSHILIAAGALAVMLLTFTHFGTDDGLSGLSSGLSDKFMSGKITSIMANSEKLWAKTVRQRHEVLERFKDMDLFPAVNAPTYFTTPYSVWDLVPASYNCPFEVERIGRMGDGGKWVCGMSRYESNRRPCIIYSFGVQNESSFEEEMLERTNCEIWGYDFSVDNFGPAIRKQYSSRTHFQRVAIAATTDKELSPPHWNIQDLMEKNGHDHIDVLKMDVEFAEFETMTSLVNHVADKKALPIGQMLIEIHVFGWTHITLPNFIEWWESMEAKGMRPAWTEPNLLAVTLSLEDKNPRLAEYSMINVADSKNILFA